MNCTRVKSHDESHDVWNPAIQLLEFVKVDNKEVIKTLSNRRLVISLEIPGHDKS